MSKRRTAFSKEFKARVVLEALKEKFPIGTSEKIGAFTESNFGLEK